ncbi:HAD family hydrolase [Phenylobacterium sp.]|uniref:HAD family hydrolase n=1 Tax=Phenylobacterium sp. TaxID=1871053 RepID=UPI002715B6D0|nr:HAD family hydrolase [Phenylobacterium sp.]MDO8378313.1 HAD family hydrolase [Phenylobacterium sp.]
MIRLIATDLDGTLLRRDGSISERTRKALGNAREAGLPVVFVTARPPRDLHAIAHDLGITGLAVCSNGALLYDVAEDRVMRQETLPTAVALELIGELRRSDPHFSFATEHGHKVGREDAFPTAMFDGFVHHHEPRVDPVHTLCDEDLIKILVHHPAHGIDDLHALIAALAGDRVAVTHSGAPFVEFGALGVSKASGLLHLGQDLGIEAHEIIAFGDMPNDIPMLTLAGRGVAVANAHPHVLAAARETTHTNEEDGVARVIETLLG